MSVPMSRSVSLTSYSSFSRKSNLGSLKAPLLNQAVSSESTCGFGRVVETPLLTTAPRVKSSLEKIVDNHDLLNEIWNYLPNEDAYNYYALSNNCGNQFKLSKKTFSVFIERFNKSPFNVASNTTHKSFDSFLQKLESLMQKSDIIFPVNQENQNFRVSEFLKFYRISQIYLGNLANISQESINDIFNFMNNIDTIKNGPIAEEQIENILQNRPQLSNSLCNRRANLDNEVFIVSMFALFFFISGIIILSKTSDEGSIGLGFTLSGAATISLALLYFSIKYCCKIQYKLRPLKRQKENWDELAINYKAFLIKSGLFKEEEIENFIIQLSRNHSSDEIKQFIKQVAGMSYLNQFLKTQTQRASSSVAIEIVEDEVDEKQHLS